MPGKLDVYTLYIGGYTVLLSAPSILRQSLAEMGYFVLGAGLPFTKLLALGYANGLFNDNSMTIEVDKQSR